MTIKLRRGLRFNLPPSGQPGEAFFAYDTGELFIADSGGILTKVNSYESNFAEKIYNAAKSASYNADALVKQTERNYDNLMRRYVCANLIGGGTISWVNNSIKWSSRIIAIGGGIINYSYYEVVLPAVGITIPRLGATNVAVTTDGVPLQAWDTLYYKIPVTNTNPWTVNTNFFILPYAYAGNVDYNAAMIGMRSNDNGYLYLFNRQRVAPGGSISY